jgi:outer membrane protein OmpA-like peptidoglycan-associated protein/arsenate reductase-like glutaredoxin family protein
MLVDLKENAASAYRRGSVLGFTIGEVFILLSFILLLILLLKQAEVFEKQKQVDALDEQFTNATISLTETEDTLQKVQARLMEAERRLEIISILKDTPDEELVKVIVQATRPGRQELLNSVRDLSDEAALNLAKAFEVIESPEDLASNIGELGGVDPFTLTRGVTIARSIQDLDPRVAEEEVLDAIRVGTIINDNLNPSDWRRLETLLQATGWSPQALKEAYDHVQALDRDTKESLADRVGRAFEEERQRWVTLGSSLKDALGDVIESRGGQIDGFGTISFSDATLFPKGSPDLTPEMESFLDELCVPWLSTLKNQGFEIEEIRIEGHASPGWSGARNDQEAYLKNLLLSQSRAYVVLDYCINITWDQDLGRWARDRTVAIGYSSSRPVIENGEISPEGSQRVMLSAAPDISDIMQEIEESVTLERLSRLDESDSEPKAVQYDRSLFGGWVDTDDDCQNTRHELLQEVSLAPITLAPSNCTVVSGKWYDPYSGKTLTDAEQVDVDHLVPLKWAWDRGASAWGAEKREAFANDSANLMVVDKGINREKGANGPLDWLPPKADYRCQYVRHFREVISSYQIPVPLTEVEELIVLENEVCE